MAHPNDTDAVRAVLQRINDAWLHGRPRDLASSLAPDIVMVFPGFAGHAEGRAAVVAGFADFCATARLERHRLFDEHVHAVGTTAVASFAFELVYEREGVRYRSTGHDVWVFTKQAETWLAVWRTMVDVGEAPA
ncbi:MAG: nuclear transport factor 2 family protein [Gemmatimonadota bacterium]|nr:nuclear transport factor 2 family protein [Gemmatimonadota bacterium]